jgi:hypothetical protein
MQLSLVVSKDNVVVESERLAWSPVCCKRIIPPRKPDMHKGNSKGWIIPVDKRGVFLDHVDKVFDSAASVTENLYGFFSMAGIDLRWFDDKDSDWILVYSARGIGVGDKIRA